MIKRLLQILLLFTTIYNISTMCCADTISQPLLINNIKVENWQDLLLSQGYKAVPIRFVSNGFSAESVTALVDGSVDGKTFQPFIIDTGSALTTIDANAVQENQLKYQNKSKIMGGGDSQRHRANQVLVATLQFKEFIAKDVVAYTQNNAFIKLDKNPIAGKIGLDFLKKYQAILDIPKKILYLKFPVDNEKKLKTSTCQHLFYKAGLQQINLESSPTGHALITVRVNNNNPVTFLFDSGAPNTMLSLSYAKKLGLEMINLGTGKGSGGGNMEIFKTHVKEISIGSGSWLEKDIMVSDLTHAIVGIPLFGVLGFDWMLNNNAIIDFSDNCLFI